MAQPAPMKDPDTQAVTINNNNGVGSVSLTSFKLDDGGSATLSFTVANGQYPTGMDGCTLQIRFVQWNSSSEPQGKVGTGPYTVTVGS